MTEIQSRLFDFVKSKHGEQKRKYTGEPYYTHLLSVAEIVSKYEPELIEIAICHDLFEDTDCNFHHLYSAMVDAGYSREFSYDTCTAVKELTDVYTHADYPYMKRAQRKENEAKRLGKISSSAQTVKYADLIDNTNSIIQHDPNFAKVYLKEKQHILKLMVSGNQELFELCKASINLPRRRQLQP